MSDAGLNFDTATSTGGVGLDMLASTLALMAASELEISAERSGVALVAVDIVDERGR